MHHEFCTGYLGEVDKAIEWLEKTYEGHDVCVYFSIFPSCLRSSAKTCVSNL